MVCIFLLFQILKILMFMLFKIKFVHFCHTQIRQKVPYIFIRTVVRKLSRGTCMCLSIYLTRPSGVSFGRLSCLPHLSYNNNQYTISNIVNNPFNPTFSYTIRMLPCILWYSSLSTLNVKYLIMLMTLRKAGLG